MPQQPGSGFNHQIHAGKLGLWTAGTATRNVEESWHANVPAVEHLHELPHREPS